VHQVKPSHLVYHPEDLSKPDKPCPNIKLIYDDAQAFHRALAALQSEFQDARYQHAIVFHGKAKTRIPQVDAAPAVDGAVTVRVTMPTGPLADAAVTAVLGSVPGATVECDTVFKVAHVGTFPQVDTMLAHVQERTGVTAVRFARSPPRVITITPGTFIGHLLTNGAKQKTKHEEKFNVKFEFPKDESKPNTIEGDDADVQRCVQVCRSVHHLFLTRFTLSRTLTVCTRQVNPVSFSRTSLELLAAPNSLATITESLLSNSKMPLLPRAHFFRSSKRA
jgi:hypothetical protein